MANLIRLPEVRKITGLSRAGIYKAMTAGTFPTQIPIGDRAVAWIEDEIFDWRDARIESARNQDAQPEVANFNSAKRKPANKTDQFLNPTPSGEIS